MTDMSDWAAREARLNAAYEARQARKLAKKLARGGALIPLGGSGHSVIVDEKYYAELSRYKWNYKKSRNCDKIYAKRTAEAPGSTRSKSSVYQRRQVCIFLHNEVMRLAGIPRPSPKHIVDHNDNDSLNCRENNLEWVTIGENNRRARARRQ